MVQLSLKSKIFHGIHLFGLFGVAIGLPFNKIVLSIALMLLLANLLVQANFKSYWQHLKSNKLFLMIAAFWLLHIVGLLWTQEIDFALRDIRVKLPLIILPFVVTAQPITKKEIRFLLIVFVAAVFVTSTINFLSFTQIFGEKSYTDIRGMSLFGSHIRYGIMVGFASAICTYFLIEEKKMIPLLLAIISWFAYYTYFSEIMSGALAFIIGIACLVFPLLYSKSKLLAWSILIVGGGSIVAIAVSLFVKPHHEIFNLEKADKLTAEGNEYTHIRNEFRDVYGNYIFTYWCEKELRREWNASSAIQYDSLDLRKQELRYTLLRYMASKKLRKDAKDFKQLSEFDIKNVENGIAEDPTIFKGIWNRINGIRYQIHYSTDPNGHSLLQRVEFWKAGWEIAKDNWLIGVGTGDTQIAFDKQYEKMNSPLSTEHRFRAHNSYLTVWISFGLFSLLFFYLLFAFTRNMLAAKNYLGFAFILISLATFLIEDTLETQMGVTFFAFFYALFSIEIKEFTSK
ncbi:MAG: O-antigen ligase family protein [Bacteroidota bacterium]